MRDFNFYLLFFIFAAISTNILDDFNNFFLTFDDLMLYLHIWQQWFKGSCLINEHTTRTKQFQIIIIGSEKK